MGRVEHFTLVAALVAVIGGYMILRESRGIRNNNPMNIRADGTQWRGAVGDDGEFVQFDSPVMGIRAAARILRTYRQKYGLSTIGGIVSRWAPPSENDTASYIKSVAAKVGKIADADLSDSDYPALMAAMIYHENGKQPYPQGDIQAGFEMGFYS